MNLSGIDLNLLLTLHVVLAERSVTRAASRLHVTSPAVSNALARLRGLLGDPLLVRDGRGLVPTPRALELAPHLERVVAELELALEGDGAFDPATTTRTFAIACSDADQMCSVPLIATEFARRLPRARLRARSIDDFQASGGFASPEMDLVIAPVHPVPPRVYSAPLGLEQAVLVVRRDHPRVRGRMTSEMFNTLRQVDIHLVLGHGGIGHEAVDAFTTEHGLTRNVALVVPSFSAAAMVVASTDLVTGMPQRLAERFAELLPLRIVDLPGPTLQFDMHLFWHERTHDDPGSGYFRELVLECLRRPPARRRRRARPTAHPRRGRGAHA
jgi:DNA-binding transcriptional LysR family regulator